MSILHCYAPSRIGNGNAYVPQRTYTDDMCAYIDLCARYASFGVPVAALSEVAMKVHRSVKLVTIGNMDSRKGMSGELVPTSSEIKLNDLLSALPETQIARWLPHLELVEMPLGAVLYESGKLESHAYFPTSGIISLLYVMKNGDSAEIAVVGNEGMVGVALFMGGNTTTSRAVVQAAGLGYRLKASYMSEAFDLGGPVAKLLLRYTQALMTQMAQTAVCNRHHSLDEQLCRWMLLSLDRLPGNELAMTQELISNMLGVRREGVTEAALKIQAAGMISYSRGRIKVLDRAGLEQRACECYSVVKEEYDRLLPHQMAS